MRSNNKKSTCQVTSSSFATSPPGPGTMNFSAASMHGPVAVEFAHRLDAATSLNKFNSKDIKGKQKSIFFKNSAHTSTRHMVVMVPVGGGMF